MDIKKQAFLNTVGNIIYLLSLWLLTVITTRFLGYDAAGTLTLAMAVGNVISTIQIFGVRGYQSSDMTFQYSSRDYVITRVLTVIAGWMLGLAICITLHYPVWISLSIMLFILLKTSETFSDVLFGNDQRIGHLELAGYSMTARGILLIVLFCVGVIIWKSLNAALLISSGGILALSLLIDLPLHNKITGKLGHLTDRGIVGILKACFPLLLATLIPAVITAFPRVILERYYGSETLGYYGNVSTPALLLTTVVPTILIALLPGYGKMAEEKDFRKMRTVWLQSIGGVILITAAAMLGVWLLGKPVLAFVYTDEILPFVPYLYSVLIAMMLYTITMCNNTFLVSLRRNWGLMLTTLLALLLCLAVSLPLVRAWGISGAIAALGVPYAVQTIVQTVWILWICKEGDQP